MQRQSLRLFVGILRRLEITQIKVGVALIGENAGLERFVLQIARQRLISKAIEQIPAVLEGPIAAYARERAKALSDDHARVRVAAARIARVTVEPVLPTDVIGLYVLVPAGH